MTQTQQTVLALAIYTIWITLLYIRIFDKTLKKYVLSIGVLLAFWMVVRMLKTYTTGFVTEMLWYLYYIPLLLIPTFYYNCSSYLINSKNKKRRIATIIISTILFLLVITNSLHNIVFKIKSNINDYNHNIGYFIIVAWILCLIVVAIINLIKSSKNKGYKNIISISIIILIGLVYTFLYIKNIPVIRKTNMSVIIGTLFCVGLEMMLDFNLIPNNFRYKKIFKNSNLPLEIISQDGKTRIATNHSINLKENIINDIKDNKVKNTYKDNNIVKNVKAINGGYSIEEKDFSKIKEYEKKLKLIQQELIEQETILQKQRKIATEIYETKLKSEIIKLLDEKIEQKRNLINELIKEMKITDIDKMQNIKLLLNYCKRMSSLVISSYNKEKYDNKRLEIIINEMLIEAQAIGINGVLKTNIFEISSGETANIYEIIFETIMKFRETNFILYIQVNNSYTEIKYLFDSKHKNFKKEIEELQLEKLSKIEQIVDENGTITPSKIGVIEGSKVKITFTPNTGYMVDKVLVNGIEKTATGNEIEITVDEEKTVEVSYKKIPFTITVEEVTGATVDPDGIVTVSYGDNKDFTITANTGYKLVKVLVNDVEKTLDGNTLKLKNITSNMKIKVVVEKIEYKVIEGAEQTYTITEDTEARFRIDADYSLFNNKVYVDNVLVDSSNYTSKSGSTIIVLNKDYVDTLAVGEHTLKVAFTDGGEAETTFTIARKAEDNNNNEDNNENNNENNTPAKPENKEEMKDKDNGSNPKTGDNIILYVAMASISIIGLGAIIIVSKKNKKN